ncbi:hypothetical protein JPM7_1780 [Metamycoplasma equirhinis]|nr:hypothetical protein JPM7_1780 [Metamycoplasma equirhinis]
MAQAKIRKNDMVLIIAGKDKGKFAAVLATDAKNQTVTLKQVNMKTKHHKPSQENTEGKIEKKRISYSHFKCCLLGKKRRWRSTFSWNKNRMKNW